MEGLSSSLKTMEKEGGIKDIKIKRQSTIITHLLFIDDCYIFIKTKVKCTKNIKKFLRRFSEALGQTINYEKLGLISSKYTPNLIRNIITRELGTKQVIFMANWATSSEECLLLPCDFPLDLKEKIEKDMNLCKYYRM